MGVSMLILSQPHMEMFAIPAFMGNLYYRISTLLPQIHGLTANRATLGYTLMNTHCFVHRFIWKGGRSKLRCEQFSKLI
ncbi:hypothetical protein BX666DRAFT_1914089 [Dichotomocladium elegans]|nr:hypothetical protein BX666DRAFT_1914089 [Dichotomocladium elegans]